ncbi:uncharacterized protein ACN2A1_005386 [Glossina fuscipes fuscipes]
MPSHSPVTSFLPYNMQSFRRNVYLLDYHFNSSRTDFGILSKIFPSDDSISDLKIPNYNSAYKCRSDGYGGVAILARKGISFKQIPFKSAPDIVIVKIYSLKPNIVTAACYFKPNTPIQSSWDGMKRFCDMLDGYYNVIFAGDFNARNPCFGDSLSNNQGKALCENMEFSNLYCLNDNTPAYLHSTISNGCGSVLDLTFTNSTNISFKWEVKKEIYLKNSHHFPIFFNANFLSSFKINDFISRDKFLNNLVHMSLEPHIESIQNSFQHDINNVKSNIQISNSYSPKLGGMECSQRASANYKKQKFAKYPNLSNFDEFKLSQKE